MGFGWEHRQHTQMSATLKCGYGVTGGVHLWAFSLPHPPKNVKVSVPAGRFPHKRSNVKALPKDDLPLNISLFGIASDVLDRAGQQAYTLYMPRSGPPKTTRLQTHKPGPPPQSEAWRLPRKGLGGIRCRRQGVFGLSRMRCDSIREIRFWLVQYRIIGMCSPSRLVRLRYV